MTAWFRAYLRITICTIPKNTFSTFIISEDILFPHVKDKGQRGKQRQKNNANSKILLLDRTFDFDDWFDAKCVWHSILEHNKNAIVV